MGTVTRTETRKRGFLGKVFLWLFWLFQLLMIVWLIGGLGSVAENTANLQSEAERAGAAIGTALGLGMIAGFWMAGTVVLGAFVLLTRGSKVIVETSN